MRYTNYQKNSRVGFLSALFLVLTLLLSSIPPVNATGGREATISLSSSPMAQTADPGETAEYTVTIANTGSDDIIITSLSTDNTCQGYQSTIEQLPPNTVISGGGSESVTMYVNVSSQATGSCDTTATAAAETTPVPSTPPGGGTDSVTVTTTAGDGSSSEVFGVSITNVDSKDKIWNGNDDVESWLLKVENTGQLNESISITYTNEGSEAKCKSSSKQPQIDGEGSTKTLDLDAGDSQNILIEVDMEEGNDAVDKICWTVEALVSNDPQQNTSDEAEITLKIDEIHSCDFSWALSNSGSNVEADPGETKEVVLTVFNEGNSDFTIGLDKSGSKSHWITDITPSNQLLRKGEAENFLLEVGLFDTGGNPDTTVSAGDEQIITLKGLDGINGPMICNTQLGVVVGQYSDASLSLPTTTMNEIVPGNSDQFQFQIHNEGNGPDTFSVSISAPPSGWSIELDQNTITMDEGAWHTVMMNITVPENALADDAAEITISVSPNNGGSVYDSKIVSIPVSAVHSITVEKLAGDQTGRSNEYVKFPVKITNPGNIQDTFEFSVTARTQDWDYSFTSENDDPISNIQIPAGQDEIIHIKVRIPECESDNPEDCELDSSLFKVRFWNNADVQIKIELEMRAILSNRNFTMSMYFAEPESNPSTKSISLAPGGSKEIEIWAYNSGDLDDTAIFEITGMEGKGTRSISINSEDIDDAILIKKGYGIYNPTDGTFLTNSQNDETTPVIYYVYGDADEYMWLNGFGETHIVKEYAILVKLSIQVSSSTENGYSGLISINIASEHNSADVVSLSVAVNVETIHDLELESTVNEISINYPDNAWFKITITNNGNIDEMVVVSVSEGLRDWTVIIPESSERKFLLKAGESKTIDIKVEPPDTTLDDTFEFVVSVEPEDIGITARKNIELSVNGATEQGLFGILGKASQTTMISGLALVSAIGIGLLLINIMNKRKQNS